MNLSHLNEEQRQAVLHTEGPLLILAGAGSGKTRVLTHRIAYLIEEKGVYPGNILAITFTNKAAREMKDRVEKLLKQPTDIWVSTFHSACVRILRKDIDKIGYTKDFVIYDSSDQKVVLKDCYKELNINDDLYPLPMVQGKISDAKDNMISSRKYMEMNKTDFQLETIGKIYERYQNKLIKNNALDFDDLLFKTVELLEKNSDVLDFYQRKFKYIMVDEYQDTNQVQYKLVSMLADKHKNLCVVGDEDQCLIGSMTVKTPEGEIPLEKLNTRDKILCASGQGEVMVGTIEKRHKKKYRGVIVVIKTKTGKEIKGTPNHMGFARLNPQTGVYYVYLMYKKGYGYRIGKTQGVRNRDGEIANGLAVRLNQEHADKMWVLRTCFSEVEAAFYENLYSVKYGIPTVVFFDKGGAISLTQKYIDRIDEELDTQEAIIKLMEDLFIFEEYPHLMSNAVIRGQVNRRVINVTAFGGRKSDVGSGWHSHRISLNTSGDELKEKVILDFPVRDGHRNTWRVETERVEYDEAEHYVKRLEQIEEDLDIVRKAKLTDNKSYYYMPFAHMMPGMSIPVYADEKIVEDRIESVELENYDGDVYDLSVPQFRQYICGGIVVHNSIYSWRGADIRNILNFESQFSNARVIKLEQNYRSTKTILDTANCVIRNNMGRKDKKLWTSNKKGEQVHYYSATDEHEEAMFIANQIQYHIEDGSRNYDEFAVLYRTNAQSRVIEEMLIKAGIPYRIIGGLKFYDRKEIKDIIAYLRLIQNPVDDVSLKRIINVPKRGIGDRTIEKIGSVALTYGESLYHVLSDEDILSQLSKKISSGIREFVSLITRLGQQKEEMFVKELIETVLAESGYMEELRNEGTVEAQSRVENLQEFLSVAMDFDKNSEIKSLEEFLANISLMSDIDNMDSDENAVALMTLHSAKGLEFPIVFLAGMEEGLFPISRAINNDRELEEERRLCYVGITRAEEKLYISHARLRTLYGKTNYNPMSRFIREIGDQLIEGDKKATQKRDEEALMPSPGIYRGSTLAAQPSKAPTAASGGTMKPGTKIVHGKFGKGTIISVKGSGDSAELTIAFDHEGIKKLVMGFAPIKIISG